MTFTDVLALLGLSILGLIVWAAMAGMSANVEKVRALTGAPRAKCFARFQSILLMWIAVAMVFVPWLLMLISVAQRVIA